MQDQFPNTRLRRLRSDAFIRALVSENHLAPRDLVYPIFIVPGKGRRVPVESMPGVERLSIDNLILEAQDCLKLGIPAIALFPVLPDNVKSAHAEQAFDDEGLVQTAVRALKAACPELGVITDVALYPYTSDGQDGLTSDNGDILNDETVAVLVKQALSHAKAGADIVAPSDMMDGRVKAIRQALEANGFINTKILSYAAKYASSFYVPFRYAVGSAKSLCCADKKT